MCLLWSDMGSGQEGGGYYCGEHKRTFGVSIVLIAYSVNKIKHHQVARVCPHKPILHLHLMHEWRALYYCIRGLVLCILVPQTPPSDQVQTVATYR